MKKQKQRLTNVILGNNLLSDEDLAEFLASEQKMNDALNANSLPPHHS